MEDVCIPFFILVYTYKHTYVSQYMHTLVDCVYVCIYLYTQINKHICVSVPVHERCVFDCKSIYPQPTLYLSDTGSRPAGHWTARRSLPISGTTKQ